MDWLTAEAPFDERKNFDSEKDHVIDRVACHRRLAQAGARILLSSLLSTSAYASDASAAHALRSVLASGSGSGGGSGGGVGWGEVMNGGFGMLLDGSAEAENKLPSMLHWDVNNGIARRSWARNPGAQWAIDRAMEVEPKLTVTRANHADDDVISGALS